MNILRLLLSLLVTQIVFADAELELAKKYFTEAEIEESLMWEFELAYGVDGGSYSGYKTEPIKFYKSKDLTGEVFAEIDDKGLKIGDKYTCSFEDYSDEYVVLAHKINPKKHRGKESTRYFSIGRYYSEKMKNKISKIKDRARITCDEFPVLIWGDPESINIYLKLRILDGKIGRLKMRGQDVYFDASNWVKRFIHTPDTDTILKRDLTPKEYEDFVKLIHELRAVIEKGSLEDIYNFVYERSEKKNHERLFNVKTKNDFLKKKMSESLKTKMLKGTFHYYDDSPYDLVKKQYWNEKDIFMSPKNKVLFTIISFNKDRVFFSRFSLKD